MIGAVAAIALVTPSAAAQRDTRDNRAVVDAKATADLLERTDSVIEQVFSYSYDRLAEREQLLADLTTEDLREEQDALFDQILTEAPTRQLSVTSTVAASAAQWLTAEEADVVVFLDQKAVSGTDGQENASEAAFLASFERIGDEWLLDSVDAFEDR